MAPLGALVCPALQFAPQAVALFAARQVKQAVLVHVAEGAAQHLGQGQVVAGEEGEAGQGLQVVEDDVLRQFQPVGARHRRARRLQSADDLLEGRIAAADQDQEVAVAAGARGAALVEDDGAGLDLALDLQRQGLGHALAGAGGPFLIDGIGPGVALGRGFVDEQGPQVHGAGLAFAGGGVVRNLARLPDQGAGAFGRAEDCVHESQHRLGRAVGGLQRHALEGAARAGDQAVVDLGFLPQPLGPGALEGVDRLLLVADGEDGALGALDGEELAGQGAHDGPLFGGGVLRLVDQDVVDAAVQLVQHPGGGRADGQQLDRPRHQVREVERAVRRLGRLVEGGVGVGEGQQLDGVVGDLGGAQLVAGGQKLVLKIGKPACGVGRRLLGRHRFAGRAGAGQEDDAQAVEAPVVFEGVDQFGRAVLVGLGAGGHQLGHAPDLAPVQPAHEVGLDVLGRRFRIGAGQDVGAGRAAVGDAGDIIGQFGALGLDQGQQILETAPVQFDREMAVGCADRPLCVIEGGAGQFLARGVAEGDRRLVLQHGEARRDARLDGEAAQQLFAEGVDGLDLQSAGGLQGAGEQAARFGQAGGIERGGVAVVQFRQGFGQLAVVHDGPFAKPLEQAGLHLGGGGLGVGHAQDGRGRGAAQQQARHPADQGGGLARSRVGGDEDRARRVGGAGLGVEGVFGPDVEVHSASPSSAPPMTCHSQTRASRL
ncbi:hypothetical protein D3C73_579340 [compost metagenome]